MGLMTIAAGSCSDFLDHTPDERTEIDSEDKVVSLLIASYPVAAPCWLGEISSDNLIDNQTPHLPSSTNDKQILSHYNYSHPASTMSCMPSNLQRRPPTATTIRRA